MPVPDYINARAQSLRQIDTRKLRARQAYDTALETTITAAGEVDLEALVNQPARDAFKTAFANSLNPRVLAYYGIPAGAPTDIFRQNDLWNAYVGFTRTDVGNLVEGAKNRLNFETFTESTKNKFKAVAERILTGPISALNAADGPNIRTYLNTNPANADAITHIDFARLTEPGDMAQIIEEYLANGVIRPTFLEDKPYKI